MYFVDQIIEVIRELEILVPSHCLSNLFPDMNFSLRPQSLHLLFISCIICSIDHIITFKVTLVCVD